MDEIKEPIVVRESAAKDIATSSLRVLLIAGMSSAASLVINSEVVLGTVVTAAALISGVVATWLVGQYRIVQQHKKLRFLAKQVPDDIAQVK